MVQPTRVEYKIGREERNSACKRDAGTARNERKLKANGTEIVL